MIVAGIDYSLTSPAICIGEKGADFKDCLVFGFSPTKKLIGTYDNITLQEYPKWDVKPERYEALSEWTIEILKRENVELVYLEGYSYGSKGRSVVDLGENGGLLRWKLWKNEFQLIEVAPSELKKKATGKGTAPKEDMYEAFLKNGGEDIILEFQKDRGKIGNPTSDIVDAYFLMKG